MRIGIHTVSSQSGRAYLVDMLEKGCYVYGYARESAHGTSFVAAVNQQMGIYLERPEGNLNKEQSRLVPLGDSSIGHDIDRLVNESDMIILAHPAHYLLETVIQLYEAGITKRRIPLILSPSRTFAVPYLWNVLGDLYPVVSFATCPYSCKAPDNGTVYIKRRKRNWLASLEGEFSKEQIIMLDKLFPQAIFNTLPATTSLGNIGAVFHPGTYLLNYEAIKRAESEGLEYSFYMEGIAHNPMVASHLEAIDQVRLRIAEYLGLEVFGLQDNPNEQRWFTLMTSLRNKEKELEGDIQQLRLLRHSYLNGINGAIVSAQHWLDYTYGVVRIEGENLQNAIARTPTYQKHSVPQLRYIEEDVPTGLVPLLAIAERFDIDATPIKQLITIYDRLYPNGNRSYRRDLEEFSTDFIFNYLTGKYFKQV
jgi:opine dehydrogenase